MMTQLRLRSDVIWREADDEVLALDGEFGSYVSTNLAGSLLWKALARGASRAELVERLADEFGIDPGRAAQDVDAFVAQLEANRFLGT